MATELVSHIDVCLVHGVQCILPPTSRMRFELTQKEIPLGGYQMPGCFGNRLFECKSLYAPLSNSIFSIGLVFCPFLFGLEMRDKYSLLLTKVGFAGLRKTVFGGMVPLKAVSQCG